MKLALTAAGEGLESNLSPVFGRCPYFAVVQLEDEDIATSETIQNPAVNQGGGAGVLAAQTVGDQDVDALVTGNVGPRAFDVLRQLDIDIYSGRQASLRDNIEAFQQGQLEKVSSPGSMGRGRGAGPGRGAGGGAGRGPGRAAGSR